MIFVIESILYIPSLQLKEQVYKQEQQTDNVAHEIIVGR